MGQVRRLMQGHAEMQDREERRFMVAVRTAVWSSPEDFARIGRDGPDETDAALAAFGLIGA